jgi:hypothetical protein
MKLKKKSIKKVKKKKTESFGLTRQTHDLCLKTRTTQ